MVSKDNLRAWALMLVYGIVVVLLLYKYMSPPLQQGSATPAEVKTEVQTAESEYINPDTTGLYGGTIDWIDAIKLDDIHSRVFVSTESANSIYYADIDYTKSNPFSDENVQFHIVPDLNKDAGFGTIQTFAVDQASGWIYFPWWPQGQSGPSSDQGLQQGVYRCNINKGSLTAVTVKQQQQGQDQGGSQGIGHVEQVSMYDGRLFFTEQTWDKQAQTDVLNLRFGTIDSTTGAFTEDSASPIALANGKNQGQIKAPVINPVNKCLYILNCGQDYNNVHTDGFIWKSSQQYDSLSSNDFPKITLPSGSAQLTKRYQAFGIAPDGRLFLGGWDQQQNGNGQPVLLYSADDGTTWTAGTRDKYCWGEQGPNFAFIEKAGGYDAVCGTSMSEDKGATWTMVPRVGNVWVHPGPIGWDPNRSNTFYVNTDKGIAVTTDGGFGFSKAWERPDKTDAAHILVIDKGSKISRVFIVERKWNDPGQQYQNSNSDRIYYADVDQSGNTPVYGAFQAVSGMDATSEATSWNICSFTADSTSHCALFTANHTGNGLVSLYKTTGEAAPTQVTINQQGGCGNPKIYNGRLFFVDSSWGGGYWQTQPHWVDGYWKDAAGNRLDAWQEGAIWVDGYQDQGTWVNTPPASNLVFGTLDGNMNFTKGGQAKIINTGGLNVDRIVIGGDDDCVYLLGRGMGVGVGIGGSDWKIYKSSDSYDSLSGSTTTFTEISGPSGVSVGNWQAFGVAPDGRLFLGGWGGTNGGSTIAYSENDGTSWDTVSLTNENCGIGNDFVFMTTPTGYDTFCGTMVSDDKGQNWSNLPRKDNKKAWPNSSCAKVDPNRPQQVLYMPTSKGMGVSPDAGSNFYDINAGIEAVQITDLVLDPATGKGWSAEKGGIRQVSYFTTKPVWNRAMDPDDKGGWYNVIDMDLSDKTGNTAYAGGQNGDGLFKTTDGGEHWKTIRRPQPQLSQEQMTNGQWANWSGNVSAIKVDPTSDGKRIFVGYSTGTKGWGNTSSERVFGQLWVIDDTTVHQPQSPAMMGGGPQQNTDWSQILLRADDATNKKMISNTDNGQTWYNLKGDMNIADILITQESSQTVIYVAAFYSDETATPTTDDQLKNNGLYDNAGYPLHYTIYRITGDGTAGYKVEVAFDQADIAMTCLDVDSSGTVYACGKDYSQATYDKYLEAIKTQYRQEMRDKMYAQQLASAQENITQGFHDQACSQLGFPVTAKNAQSAEDKNSQNGPSPEDQKLLNQLFSKFYDKYFKGYQGQPGAEFEAYFKQSFDEFWASDIQKEFEKLFTKEFDKQFNQNFDMQWNNNMPQQGLRVVYKKALGGKWERLPMDGLNRAFTMDWQFNRNQEVMTVGLDPQDGKTEVPYVAYNRFIYYLPKGADKWAKVMEYPTGTEIYVIVGVNTSAQAAGAELAHPAEDNAYLYVGTGTGLYGQTIVLTQDARDVIEGGGGGGGVAGVPLSALIGGIAAVIVVGGVATFLLLRRRRRPGKLAAAGVGEVGEDDIDIKDVTMRLDKDDIDVDDM